jgi:hypothetical protein
MHEEVSAEEEKGTRGDNTGASHLRSGRGLARVKERARADSAPGGLEQGNGDGKGKAKGSRIGVAARLLKGASSQKSSPKASPKLSVDDRESEADTSGGPGEEKSKRGFLSKAGVLSSSLRNLRKKAEDESQPKRGLFRSESRRERPTASTYSDTEEGEADDGEESRRYAASLISPRLPRIPSFRSRTKRGTAQEDDGKESESDDTGPVGSEEGGNKPKQRAQTISSPLGVTRPGKGAHPDAQASEAAAADSDASSGSESPGATRRKTVASRFSFIKKNKSLDQTVPFSQAQRLKQSERAERRTSQGFTMFPSSTKEGWIYKRRAGHTVSPTHPFRVWSKVSNDSERGSFMAHCDIEMVRVAP